MSQTHTRKRRYSITKAWKTQRKLLSDGSYCSINPEIANNLDRMPGQQIRIDPIPQSSHSAVFTIDELHDDDADVRVSKKGRTRLEMSPGDQVTLFPIAPEDLTRMQACEQDTITEIVWDHGATDLIICAPHAGDIESNTGQAASIVRKKVGRSQASAWFVFSYGPNAFERFHVTSGDISSVSYPGLNSLAERGFNHAVSFHVWNGDEILVGGRADKHEREQVAERLRQAVNGTRPIVTDYDDMKYAGNTEQNFVNWLTMDNSGIQIEMPPLIAHRYRKRVARAVARFYNEIL